MKLSINVIFTPTSTGLTSKLTGLTGLDTFKPIEKYTSLCYSRLSALAGMVL